MRDGDGDEPRVVRDSGARRFAGWDHTGRLLAYTAPDPSLPPASPWTTLLLPAPAARDAVYVTEGRGPGRVVFCGLRVTFPRWSPQEDKLSLWLTFEPPYQSVLSRLFRLGLRPATRRRCSTCTAVRRPGWRPALSEKRRSATTTWRGASTQRRGSGTPRRTASRRPRRPALRPPSARPLTAFRSPLFFEYYCLTKLGRDAEAGAKLEQFRRLFALPAADAGAARGADLLRDLYTAEVFLSLDAAADGRASFRRAIREAASDEQRLSAALVLSQVLLAEGRGEEYLELACDVALPNLLRVWKQENGSEFIWPSSDQKILPTCALLGLRPPGDPGLPGYPAGSRRAPPGGAASWPRGRGPPTAARRLALDLVLRTAYKRLGQQEEARQADSRVGAASAGRRLPSPEALGAPVAWFRSTLAGTEQMLELLGVR